MRRLDKLCTVKVNMHSVIATLLLVLTLFVVLCGSTDSTIKRRPLSRPLVIDGCACHPSHNTCDCARAQTRS